MSNFIPNSFQIPNIIIDEVMKQVSPNALKCYLVIVRKTTGWNKEWDKISTTQLMQFTGIKKKETIYNSINELESINLIETVKTNGKLTSYKVVTINGTGTEKGDETSTEKRYPTKTTKTKENVNQDLPIDSGVLEDSFKELWKDYSLTFLKAQGRAGGLKANALKGYKSLIKFGASVEEIYKYCEHHAGMKFGHKDLERLLRIDLYRQYLEDVK